MKYVVWILVAAGLLAAAAVGGGAVGRQMGYDAVLRDVGEYLLGEADSPPWEGRGDAGFTLCLALSEVKNVTDAAAQCLQEVRPQEEAEVEEKTEAEKILEEISYPPPGNGGR